MKNKNKEKPQEQLRREVNENYKKIIREIEETFSDKNGKPDFDKANKQENKDERKYPCPKCNSYLIRRSSPKYQGKYFWGCSKYPECKFTTYDDNGKPKDLL